MNGGRHEKARSIVIRVYLVDIVIHKARQRKIIIIENEIRFDIGSYVGMIPFDVGDNVHAEIVVRNHGIHQGIVDEVARGHDQVQLRLVQDQGP